MKYVQLEFESAQYEDIAGGLSTQMQSIRTRDGVMTVKFPAASYVNEVSYTDGGRSFSIDVPEHVYKEFAEQFSYVGRRAWEDKVRDLRQKLALQTKRKEGFENALYDALAAKERAVEQAHRWKRAYAMLRDKTRKT